MDGPTNKIRGALFVAKESALSFHRNDHYSTAAALAYYGFFGIIPLLLLAVFVLGNYLVSSATALKEVDVLTSRIFPEFSKVIIREIHAISRRSGGWGLLGLLGVFWAVMPLTGGVRAAFEKIHRVEKRAHFARETLFDAGAVFIILALFVVMALSGAGYSILSKQLLYKVPFAYKAAYFLYPLLLTLLFLAIFYLLFSPRLEARRFWTGLLTSAVLWMALREFFSYFLDINPTYGLAYGSFKAVFIMTVWVYLSFCVILMGAEIMATMGRKETLLIKELFYGVPPAGSGRERMLAPFIKNFPAGETLFSEGERGDRMYYILSGGVLVHRGGRPVKSLAKGDFFGDMALILGKPRMASVRAGEEGVKVVEISSANFQTITAEDPNITLVILRRMAMRLREAEEYI